MAIPNESLGGDVERVIREEIGLVDPTHNVSRLLMARRGQANGRTREERRLDTLERRLDRAMHEIRVLQELHEGTAITHRGRRLITPPDDDAYVIEDGQG